MTLAQELMRKMMTSNLLVGVKTMIKRLLPLLLLASPVFAQTSFYTNQATQAVSIVGSPQPVQGPIPFAGVRVCNLPLTQTQPCLPLATITDQNGNTLSNSVGSNFGQFSADSFGRFTFGCTTGANLRLQWAGASNTPQGDIPITCPGSGFQAGGNNTFSGTNTFTGLLNCANLNGVRCINTANSAGWAGSDFGAWVNSAISNCAGVSCPIYIAPGNYNYSTPIVFSSGSFGALICTSGGASATLNATVLNYTPATGTAITASATGGSFKFEGCTLTTSTSTTSKGISIQAQNQVKVDDFKITGFNGGSLQVTGDGVSQNSIGVRLSNGRIDGYCGSSSYGVSADHVSDMMVIGVEMYPTSNCATSIGFIMDTGISGLWMSGSTLEQGISGLIVRNTNQGGAYGGAPGAIWIQGMSISDVNPGGNGVVFDSTLGTSPVRFFCNQCWEAFAGRNNAGTVITAAAIGIDIEGGSHIAFNGGYIRGGAGWGMKINTTGSEITVNGMQILGNNQGNTAGVGGILVTANPTHVNISNVISRNDAIEGGNQAYGIDVSAVTASQFVVVSGADNQNNATNRINLPAGFNGPAIDAPDYFNSNGLNLYGALSMPEAGANVSAISGGAGVDIIHADSTLHGLMQNINNVGWTALSSKVVLTADWTCGTGGTVASCVAATIIGSGGGVPMTFTLPANLPGTASYQLDCDGVVGQATAATANQWNLLTATNGATNVTASYSMATAATAAAFGAVTDQASTTTTFQIAPSWTLGGTATKMPFHIHAAVEGGSTSGTVLSLQLVAPTVGDLVTIYRGMACWLH